MPFYSIDKMDNSQDTFGPPKKMVAGEFIKIGIVTYGMGEGPDPHFHPNEEQFILMLGGKVNFILGDESKVIGQGDIVHIPRNVEHGLKVVEAPAVFFACKSPVGDGKLSQDYNQAKDVAALKARLAEVL
ncbi:MAG: cupin domain-containing protein [Pseudomonadota bacterium]|jgi:quercetin dioxygenase-like cupin family protein|nr:cupin domain-containing protein [Hyphomicrobiales bacterium]